MKDFSGCGYRYLFKENRLDFIFEAAGMAEDDKGNPTPAGCLVKMELQENAIIREPAEYEERAKRIAKAGIKDMGLGRGVLTPLTWEEYCKRGYNRFGFRGSLRRTWT